MAQILQNLTEVWNRTSLTQRVLLVAVLLGCIGAGVVLVGWAGKPDMAMLYTKLSPEDASKICDKLREADCPFELKDGGTTILVPHEKVYSLRLAMAADGIPDGAHAGYKILDKQDFGASPFQLEVGYIRAVEGELAKSIQLIDGVSSVRVHVNRPRAQVFLGKERRASASVVLKLKGGGSLSPGRVPAIVHLVAGAVESLSPGDVSVIDQSGRLYTEQQDGSTDKSAKRMQDYKTQLELDLSSKAEQVLAMALGEGRATVRVCITVDRDLKEETSETYDKTNRGVTKEETLDSTTPGGKDGPTKESSFTGTYQPGKTYKVTRTQPGKILTKTVAAVVDLSVPEGSQATPMTLEECKKLITTAVGGISKTDELTVTQTSIPTVVAVAAPPDGMFTKDFLLDMGRKFSLGLLVIGALLVLKMLGGGTKKKVTTAGSAALEGAGGLPQTDNLLPLSAGGDVDPEALRASITHALRENPDEVKRLFLSWAESESKGEA